MNDTAKRKTQLIVGLDLPSIAKAEKVVGEIGDACRFYKIGYQLVFSGGLEFARDLIADGRQVFLDMKLLDIDHTVARGVEKITEMGVSMLTVHAYPRAMRAAAEAARGSPTILLAVTVLTSMDDHDVTEAGYSSGVAALVARRAGQAREEGMGGIVCSASEASRVREIVGSEMAVVTPGIRPAGTPSGDQKRVMTPLDAIRAGASHLVVARPIIGAVDKRAATLAILGEMTSK